MDIYFILWGIIQCSFIHFVALITPAMAPGSSFSWFLRFLWYAPIILWVLFLLEHFLTFCACQILQTHLLSPKPVLEKPFLQRSLVPFSCEWYLDTKTLVPAVLTANWSVIDFTYFSFCKKVIFMYVLIWLHWVFVVSCGIFSCSAQTLICSRI